MWGTEALRQDRDGDSGFWLTVRERLFGTGRAAPQNGHDHMTIGPPPWQDGRSVGPWGMLWPRFEPPDCMPSSHTDSH